AMFDHFRDLETVPASLFLTKHRVGRDIEIEAALNFTRLRATSKGPDNEAHPGEQHHDHGWNSHRIQHRHNHNNRDRLRREFPYARHNSSNIPSHPQISQIILLCNLWINATYFSPRRAMIAAPACSVESCPPRSLVVSFAEIAL